MNAIYNIILNILFALGLTAIVFMLFPAKQTKIVDEVAADKPVHRISDYAATEFKMTVMNKQGKPSHSISGNKIAHYLDDDSTEISVATAHIIEAENNDWIATAEKAITQGKGEIILLTGDVIISQSPNSDIELTTDKLTLDTVHNTAYTDTATHLTSPNGVTDSVGFHASLEDKTINLHSRVKGHYNAPLTP